MARRVGAWQQRTHEQDKADEESALRSAMDELEGKTPGASARFFVGEVEWSRQIWLRLRECGPVTVAKFAVYTKLTRYYAQKDLNQLLRLRRAFKSATGLFMVVGDAP